jgi:DNA protecting protein DprA
MEEEIFYLLGLSQVDGIGDILARKLLQHFGSAKALFAATAKELKYIEGIDHSRISGIRKGFDAKTIEKEMHFIASNAIEVHSILSASYPERLKQINDAPCILFSKGNIDLNQERPVAIVGSRHNTLQGKQFTEELIQTLKDYGVFVISGLAYGIDIIAHKAALSAGLPTLAVLAHGLDQVYPAAHRHTVDKMLQNGGIISEYPSGSELKKQNFPARNRIVAGMAEATIVIETDIKGGAMITAKLALNYNRDVFALPGRYNDPRSDGCNYLIKTNIAQLITEGEDIALFMDWQEKDKKALPGIQPKLFATFSGAEQALLQLIQQKESIHVDELQIKSGQNSSNLARLLLQLEFMNAIISLPGKRYKLM